MEYWWVNYTCLHVIFNFQQMLWSIKILEEFYKCNKLKCLQLTSVAGWTLARESIGEIHTSSVILARIWQAFVNVEFTVVSWCVNRKTDNVQKLERCRVVGTSIYYSLYTEREEIRFLLLQSLIQTVERG